MTGLPIPDAAQELGVSVATLRRWIQRGCPVASRGRRGRGCRALIDPGEVRAWRQAGEREAVLMELASALPGVLADAVCESWQRAEGIDKRRLANVMTATWYIAATAVNDHMREHCLGVPEVSSLPDPIQRLRKIAAR